MNEQRYGRESPAADHDADERSARPVDDISVVPTPRDDVTPPRMIAPAVAPRNSPPATPLRADVRAAEPPPPASARPLLRAVDRPAGTERSGRDPVASAVETFGAAVGWTAGYVRNRPAAELRGDAERFVVASPALALVAALGFGFLVGSYMRR